MLRRRLRETLTVVLAVAAGIVAIPTAARAETRLGVQGGVAFSTQVSSPPEGEEGLDTGSLTGFAGGLVLDVDVGSRVWLRLAPGWVERGSTFSFDLFSTSYPGRFELDYVELPATLNLALTSGSVRPYVSGGATVGYLARSRTVAVREDGEESQDAQEHFRDWDFGVTVGLGVELGAGRTRGFFEGRHTWGLTNLWTDETITAIKNRGWQLLVGVTFQL